MPYILQFRACAHLFVVLNHTHHSTITTYNISTSILKVWLIQSSATQWLWNCRYIHAIHLLFATWYGSWTLVRLTSIEPEYLSLYIFDFVTLIFQGYPPNPLSRSTKMCCILALSFYFAITCISAWDVFQIVSGFGRRIRDWIWYQSCTSAGWRICSLGPSR